MEPEPRRIWVAKVYDMNAARALLDHADNILAGYRFAEESVEPLLTVASIGCEKVLKMTLGVINTEVHGAWPSKQVMKTFGHDVVTLDSQCRRLFRERSVLAVAKGYFNDLQDEADADPLIGTFLTVLARYAANGRFYYLDDLADNPQDLPAPSEFWWKADPANGPGDPQPTQRDQPSCRRGGSQIDRACSSKPCQVAEPVLPRVESGRVRRTGEGLRLAAAATQAQQLVGDK